MGSLVLGLASFCLLLAVRPAWTMDEAPSSAPLQPSSRNLDLDEDAYQNAVLGLELQGEPDKRAYTYVSEYKRLPIYNFGLGKRWGPVVGDEEKRARLYSFGLGKRARPYNFGLGKRGGDSSQSTFGVEDYEELAREPFDEYPDKRSRHLYSFGLGKRMSPDEGLQRFNFGLGKRGSEDLGHRYKFGLGKRRLMVDDNDQQPSVSS